MTLTPKNTSWLPISESVGMLVPVTVRLEVFVPSLKSEHEKLTEKFTDSPELSTPLGAPSTSTRLPESDSSKLISAPPAFVTIRG